jgi:hypothetical protein
VTNCSKRACFSVSHDRITYLLFKKHVLSKTSPQLRHEQYNSYTLYFSPNHQHRFPQPRL